MLWSLELSDVEVGPPDPLVPVLGAVPVHWDELSTALMQFDDRVLPS